MKPRQFSSKKWTQFPKDYITQIEGVFHDAFASQLQNGKLIVEGRIYPEEILLRVGYLENGRIQQNNFEVSMPYSADKDNAIERIHNCIDAAASLMNEYFESNGEVDFPRVWKNFDFNGKQIWVQYSTVNTELEAQADQLLGEANSNLVSEEQETEDALSRTEESLHDHPEEDEDYLEDDADENLDENSDENIASESDAGEASFTTPKMFGGKKKKKEDLH